MIKRPSSTGNFVGTFLLSFFTYLWTLAPTVIWGDSAGFALEVRRSSLRIGTASDHPLYILLGRIFARLPGELAWNLNLLSALFGALTVAFIYAITFKLTHSPSAGWTAATALCFSHAFWLHAVITEVYTLHAFFVALLIYLLLVWREHPQTNYWLYLIGFTLLLGLTNHLILASLLPALIYFIVVTDPSRIFSKKGVVKMIGFWGVAFLLFLIFPGSFITTIQKLWFGPPPIYHYFTFPEGNILIKEVLFYFLYLMYQFPWIGFILGFWGIKSLLEVDVKTGIFLLLAMGINGLFFIKTTAWPSLGSTKYTFYISDYVIFSLFIGYGTFAIVWKYGKFGKGYKKRKTGGRLQPFDISGFLPLFLILAIVAAPLLTYNLTPYLVKSLHIDLLHAREIPFRDNTAFFLNPGKRGEYGARRFGEEALRVVKPDAILIADYTPYTVLLYLQEIEALRPDVIILSSNFYGSLKDLQPIVAEHFPEHPVYLAGINSGYYKIDNLQKNFNLVRVGPLFEVTKK
ncbi:MAG TPA: DUF2723 domain-containing protein [Candidatus Limnocylindrales bacterium]|nr:DUF2723 domain-containing protein [Candidatus Limnocylindrales bacterium]